MRGLLLEQLLALPGDNEGGDAVTWRGGKMSHHELRKSALAIAHYLVNLGIGPGCRVAICLPKSPASVEAICGILFSGAAYLPLDIFSPPVAS